MAGFDKSLDKEIFGKDIRFDNTKLRISVYSYNEGTPKVQINRENFDESSNEFRWTKLGRLQKHEVEAIIPLLKEAIENM